DADGGVDLEAEARAPAQAGGQLGRRFGGGEGEALGHLEADQATHLADDGEALRHRHGEADAVLKLRADVQIGEVAAAARDDAGLDGAVHPARLILGDEAEAAGDAALPHENRRIARRKGGAEDAGEAEALMRPVRRPQEALDLERQIADAARGEVGDGDGARVVELIGKERQVEADLEAIEDGERADEIHAELAHDDLAGGGVAATEDEWIVAVAEPQARGEAEVRRDEGAVDAEVAAAGDGRMEVLGVEAGRARRLRVRGERRDEDGGNEESAADHAERRRSDTARKKSAMTRRARAVSSLPRDDAAPPASAQPPPPTERPARSPGFGVAMSSTRTPPSGTQSGTGAVAHWLATHVAMRHSSVGVAQSSGLLQQPSAPVEPKTHMLSSHAVACWQALPGVQSVGELQQGDAPEEAKPQLLPLQVGVWQALPAGQAVHMLPQVMTLVSSLQTPL